MLSNQVLGAWLLAKRDAKEVFSAYREADAAIWGDTSYHNVRSRQLSMRAESKCHPASCMDVQLKCHHLMFFMVPVEADHVWKLQEGGESSEGAGWPKQKHGRNKKSIPLILVIINRTTAVSECCWYLGLQEAQFIQKCMRLRLLPERRCGNRLFYIQFNM